MGQFLDARAVAPAGKGSGKKALQAGLGHVDPDQPRAHCDDVRIVVFAREFGGIGIADERAAAGRIAVDRDRDADAAAAQRDAALGRSVGDGGGKLVAIVGIVDGPRSITS
jgi:hypothetical protein